MEGRGREGGLRWAGTLAERVPATKGLQVFSRWAKRKHSSVANWTVGEDRAALWVMYNPHYLAFRLAPPLINQRGREEVK